MADPTIVTLTRDTWVKVASSVTSATIDIRKSEPLPVYQTYRMAGGSAPTDMTDATICDYPQQLVQTGAAIDVYMYAQGWATTAKVSL